MIGLKLDRYDSGGASHPTCPPKHWRRRKLRNLGSIVAVGSEGWWRRGESKNEPMPPSNYLKKLALPFRVPLFTALNPLRNVPFSAPLYQSGQVAQHHFSSLSRC